MKVTWLTDYSVEDESYLPLCTAIEKAGHNLVSLKYRPFQDNNLDIVGDDECVIFWGSINLAREIQRRKPWVPGVYANFHNFKCSTYYTYYGNSLLNKDYLMMPLAELRRRVDNKLLPYEWFFVRPNDGTKPFGGQGIGPEHNWCNLRYIEGLCSPETLVLTAPTLNITYEWRMIVCNGKVITGSLYKTNDRPDFRSWIPTPVYKFAEYLATREWKPDSVYTIDIGQIFDPIEHNASYGLLELSSFSCSGLYACDMDIIVEKVSEQALREYGEIND